MAVRRKAAGQMEAAGRHRKKSRAATASSPSRPSSVPTSSRHSTQEHPFEVVIHYPHHPRAGECVLAFRRLIHGSRLHFVIEQPDGCRVLLPAWMTENSAATLPMVAAPRVSLDALRELRGLIDAQRLSSSPSSETNRMGGGDDGTTCRMATARSPGARNKRKPAPATRSDDSRGGHGGCSSCLSTNAAPPSQR